MLSFTAANAGENSEHTSKSIKRMMDERVMDKRVIFDSKTKAKRVRFLEMLTVIAAREKTACDIRATWLR
jgi:hypothetical protein